MCTLMGIKHKTNSKIPHRSMDKNVIMMDRLAQVTRNLKHDVFSEMNLEYSWELGKHIPQP